MAISNPLYMSDYYCDVSEDSLCLIELTFVPPKKSKGRRPLRVNEDDKLIDVYKFEDKKKGERSERTHQSVSGSTFCTYHLAISEPIFVG